ncbi:MAG: hypothetical protein AAFN77_00580 [Planctomycetota bacterium]
MIISRGPTRRVLWPIVWLLVVSLLPGFASETLAGVLQTPDASVPTDEQLEQSIQQVGVNRIKGLNESSGLALSSTDDTVWSINDSGNPSDLFLLQLSGKLAGTFPTTAPNVDWEAMASTMVDDSRWLVLADVGDNLLRRDRYSLYLLPEPPIATEQDRVADPQRTLPANRVDFVFDSDGTQQNDLDGFDQNLKNRKANPRLEVARPANCEAIGIDPLTQNIWLVEKVYLDSRQKTAPGIFVLKLPETAFEPPKKTTDGSEKTDPQNDKPLIAKRIGNFPVRNVTGMSFSPDGRKLLIRNYFNAHLYRRTGNTSWQETIAAAKPDRIVLPLQRQGEAVCFLNDSKSVLLTSEVEGQPIWKIDLTPYLDLPIRKR